MGNSSTPLRIYTVSEGKYLNSHSNLKSLLFRYHSMNFLASCGPELSVIFGGHFQVHISLNCYGFVIRGFSPCFFQLLSFSNHSIRCPKSFRVHSKFDDNKCNEIWIYFAFINRCNGERLNFIYFIVYKREKCNMWTTATLSRLYLQLVYFAWFRFIFLAFFETFHLFLLSTEQKHTISHTFLFPVVDIINLIVSSFQVSATNCTDRNFTSSSIGFSWKLIATMNSSAFNGQIRSLWIWKKSINSLVAQIIHVPIYSRNGQNLIDRSQYRCDWIIDVHSCQRW